MSRIRTVMEVKEKTVRQKSFAAFNKEIEGGLNPRVVFIRFKVFDIKTINAAEGLANMDFAVYLRWFDPSLIHISKQEFGRTADEYKTLWNPKLEVNNDQGLTEIWDADTSWNLKDYETGMLKYAQRYRGNIANRVDVRNFPFDSDVVTVSLGPRYLKNNKVVFKHDPDYEIDETSVSAIIADFTVATPVDVTFRDGPSGHSNVDLNIIVHRNSEYYIWKVLIINLISGMFSWSVFMTPAEEINDRISISLTLFLAEVAFLFVIADKLPQVSYLTVMDKIVLGSFILLFLTCVETVFAYTYVGENKFFSSASGPNMSAADSVDAAAIIIFPLAFFVLHLVLITKAVRKRRMLKAKGIKALSREKSTVRLLQ